MAKDDDHHSSLCVSQNSHGHFVAEQSSYAQPHFGPGQCQAPCLVLDGACRQRTMSDCASPTLILTPQNVTHTLYMNTVEAQLKEGCVVQEESDCRESLKGGREGACLSRGASPPAFKGNLSTLQTTAMHTHCIVNMHAAQWTVCNTQAKYTHP